MNARSGLTIAATMPFALTPKVPLTVVANQVIVGMATTVQVGACRSFINLLRLANPCRVTVTTHTELLGPVTVPSLMRNRPPHWVLRSLQFKNSTRVLYRLKEFIYARVVTRGLRLIVLIRED